MIRKGIIYLLLLVLFAVSGCGVSVVTPNKDAGKVNAQPKTFTYKDYPTTPGTEWVYYESRADAKNGVPFVDIHFTLQGPWDFTEGPTGLEKTNTVVSLDSLPKQPNSPNPSFAIRRVDSNGQGYFYMDNRPDALLSLGDIAGSTNSQAKTITVSSVPEPNIAYPLALGKEWSYEFSRTKSVTTRQPGSAYNGSAEFTGTVYHKVVGINRISVPAGTYDECFLIQEKAKSSNSSQVISYYWYVPGVGLAAFAQSLSNESKAVFTRASCFDRLKMFKNLCE